MARPTIITLSEAAQGLMAAFLFRGNDARGRPNSLLKSDADYQSLFSENYPLDSFKNVILTKRTAMKILSEIASGKGSSFKNDVIYHIITYISAKRFRNLEHAVNGWKTLDLSKEELTPEVATVVAMFEAEGLSVVSQFEISAPDFL